MNPEPIALELTKSHITPTQDTEFWAAWNDFEVQHGNEDTFREMLRIKRSVSASYSQTHFNTSVGSGVPAPAAAVAPGAVSLLEKR